MNVDFAFAKASQVYNYSTYRCLLLLPLLVFLCLRYTQLLSQEMDVNKLVEKAMEIIAEHAGADHGILMIRDEDPITNADIYTQLMVKAIWEVFPDKQPKTNESTQERKAGHVDIHTTMVPLDSSIIPGITLTIMLLCAPASLLIRPPESLVSFVAHSRRPVVLNDIPGSDFAYDEYLT